jgi:uncharacterized OB-fold protein
MTEERLDIIEDTITLPYRWTVGPVGARFLEGLKDKKILGIRCAQCQRTLVPARAFCPRCFVDLNDWVEVSDHGTLRSFTIVNYAFAGQPTPPPYVIGIIVLDGADVGFTHFVGGLDLSDLDKAAERLKQNTAVRAVWRQERVGRITDIEHFEPA